MQETNLIDKINFLTSGGANYWKPLEHDAAVSYLREIEEVLKKKSQWKVQNLVIGAKVPVLMANYLPKNLECKFG